MISRLLLIALFVWPVAAWRYGPGQYRDVDVCFTAFLVSGLLFLGFDIVFHWEYRSAITELILNDNRGPETSPERLAARLMYCISRFLVGPISLLWHVSIFAIVLWKNSETLISSKTNSTSCIECGHKLDFEDSLSGLEGQCPECTADLVFPAITGAN